MTDFNKDEFLEALKDANTKTEESTGMNLVATTISAVATVALLVKATRAAKKGDYVKATYYALLWHSNKQAYANSVSLHRSKPKDPFPININTKSDRTWA